MLESNVSERNLLNFVFELKPILETHGFEFNNVETSFSSGGEFAITFFSNNKIRIGLIFRGDRLGSINYETKYSNIDHDSIFRHLAIESEQELLYNHENRKSFAKDKSNLSALISDLENYVLPYFAQTSLDDINAMIKKERKKMGL